MSVKKPKKILRGRAAGIMIEDLDSKLDLIIEKVESSEQRLTERMERLENELKQQVFDIRIVVRDHSSQLNKHEEILQRHDQDISTLKVSAGH